MKKLPLSTMRAWKLAGVVIALVVMMLVYMLIANQEAGPDCILVINQASTDHEGIAWEIKSTIARQNVRAKLIFTEEEILTGKPPQSSIIDMGESSSLSIYGLSLPFPSRAKMEQHIVTTVSGEESGGIYEVNWNVKTNDRLSLEKGDKLHICTYRIGEGVDVRSVKMVFTVD